KNYVRLDNEGVASDAPPAHSEPQQNRRRTMLGDALCPGSCATIADPKFDNTFSRSGKAPAPSPAPRGTGRPPVPHAEAAQVVIRLHSAKGSSVPSRICQTLHHCSVPEIA